MTQAAFHAAQAGMGQYRVGFVAPQSRPSASGHSYMPQNARPYIASPATLEQQELQRLRNFRAAQQAALRVCGISCYSLLITLISVFSVSLLVDGNSVGEALERMLFGNWKTVIKCILFHGMNLCIQYVIRLQECVNSSTQYLFCPVWHVGLLVLLSVFRLEQAVKGRLLKL